MNPNRGANRFHIYISAELLCKRPWRHVFGALLVTVAQIAWAAPMAAPLSESFFGLHIHSSPDRIDWSEITARAWRLHDAQVTWANLQPSPRVWNFARLDQAVAAAAAHGMDIVLPLGFTPAWASRNVGDPGPYGPGTASPPATIADWAKYVAAVATRYRGRIGYYEIWNEPDLPKFFNGDATEIAQLTNSACEVLRAVDPNAKIVSASISSARGQQFLARYLKLVRPECIDIIGVHLYTDHQPPEEIPARLAKIKAVIASTPFSSRPIWNTETGWLITNPAQRSNPESVGFDKSAVILDETTAAEYLVRAHILAASIGVERFFWYAWDNVQMGLTTERLRAAYREMVSQLTGLQISACDQDKFVWSCKVKASGRKAAYIIWSTAGKSEQWLDKPSVDLEYGPILSGGCRTRASGKDAIFLSGNPLLVCTK